MNYTVLSNEINNDPLGAGYASMDAYQIRDSINEKTRSAYKVLTSNDLLKWSGINGRYIKIKTAADNTGLSDEIRSAAFAAVVMVERDNTLFDYNDGDSQSIFNRELFKTANLSIGIVGLMVLIYRFRKV